MELVEHLERAEAESIHTSTHTHLALLRLYAWGVVIPSGRNGCDAE